MTKMNKLDPVTLDFFDTAPLRVRCTMVAKCTPDVLFETLRGDTVWPEWAGVIQGVEWTSEKPYAKNATRDVSLVGGMLVKEVFFHWEENERVAFYVTDSTIPNLSKFAEDYIVERVGPNETRLIWTVAIERARAQARVSGMVQEIQEDPRSSRCTTCAAAHGGRATAGLEASASSGRAHR
jgi:hypothetical protein